MTIYNSFNLENFLFMIIWLLWSLILVEIHFNSLIRKRVEMNIDFSLNNCHANLNQLLSSITNHLHSHCIKIYHHDLLFF